MQVSKCAERQCRKVPLLLCAPFIRWIALLINLCLESDGVVFLSCVSSLFWTCWVKSSVLWLPYKFPLAAFIRLRLPPKAPCGLQGKYVGCMGTISTPIRLMDYSIAFRAEGLKRAKRKIRGTWKYSLVGKPRKRISRLRHRKGRHFCLLRTWRPNVFVPPEVLPCHTDGAEPHEPPTSHHVLNIWASSILRCQHCRFDVVTVW